MRKAPSAPCFVEKVSGKEGPAALRRANGDVAGELTSGPRSEAAAIERLEELRKTIKPGGSDWRILRYTGGLPINGKELAGGINWSKANGGSC